MKEVEEAIDDGIADIVSKWKKYELPQRQRNAYSLWRKYHHKSVRNDRLRKRKLEVQHVNDRIAKLRNEIASEEWTSKEQVRKQSRILEPSINDRELWTWEIQIIGSKQSPPRVSHSKLHFRVIADSHFASYHHVPGHSPIPL